MLNSRSSRSQAACRLARPELHSTGVTDTGLAHLKGLPDLHSLGCWWFGGWTIRIAS